MNQSQARLLSLLSYDPADLGTGSADLASGRVVWKDGEWEAVVAEARRHGLGPLLFHKLSTRFRSAPGHGPVLEKLRNECSRSAAANMWRFQRLAPALKALKMAGIPTIVLKGAYLAKAVYDNIALRHMLDVDILVRREDLGKADSALASAGFTPQEFQLSPPEDVNEFHYQERSTHAMLEVHWELTPPDYPFALDVEALWAAAVPARVAGVEVLAFSPEDLLIHIGLHATIHRFAFGLRPLCDIAEAVSHLSVNWDLLGERIRKNGVGRAVWVPLALAKELLQAAIPEDAIRRLQPPSLSGALWEEARETVMLNSLERLRRAAPNPNLVLFFGRKRWRDKFSLAFRRVFPSRKMIATLYPVPANSLRVILYYPVLFRDLLKRNAPALRAFLSGKTRHSSAHKNAAALMDWLLTRE